MPAALIIGYGVAFDAEGRVLLLHRRSGEALWPDQWWLPGGETPMEEDPDSTVPRVFADLLRQEVRAAYIDTTFGPEPSSGRHTVHNGYRVEVVSSLDPQPADERNPFDRMEWFAPEEALSALPQAQAQLLRTAVEHRILGIEPTPADDLDRLLEVGDAPNAAGAAPELPQTTQARRRADGAALLAELTGQAEFAERMEAARGGVWVVSDRPCLGRCLAGWAAVAAGAEPGRAGGGGGAAAARCIQVQCRHRRRQRAVAGGAGRGLPAAGGGGRISACQ